MGFFREVPRYQEIPTIAHSMEAKFEQLSIGLRTPGLSFSGQFLPCGLEQTLIRTSVLLLVAPGNLEILFWVPTLFGDLSNALEWK